MAVLHDVVEHLLHGGSHGGWALHGQAHHAVLLRLDGVHLDGGFAVPQQHLRHDGDIKLSVPGAHNVSNALAAIALSTTLGLNEESILTGLDKFGGADRRFQYKGKVNGVTIIDDYAHHPTEIRATLTQNNFQLHNHIPIHLGVLEEKDKLRVFVQG